MAQIVDRRRVLGGKNDFLVKMILYDGTVLVNKNTSKTTVNASDILEIANNVQIRDTIILKFGKKVTTVDFSDTPNLFNNATKKLQQVILPIGLTMIAKNGMQYMKGDLVIPDTVTYIGAGALAGYKNTSFHLPASVIRGMVSANDNYLPVLQASNNITSITVDNDNPVYDSRQNCNCIIISATNEVYQACKTSTFPESVEIIGTYCLRWMEWTGPLIFPSTIKHISYIAHGNNVTYAYIKATVPPTIHQRAFETNLTYPIYVPDESVEAYKTAKTWKDYYVDRIKPISELSTGGGKRLILITSMPTFGERRAA